MKYKIEKNVPIPTSRDDVRSGLVTIMRQMEIGDSVLVEVRHVRAVCPCARYLGIKITQRKEGDKTRVWRVADAT